VNVGTIPEEDVDVDLEKTLTCDKCSTEVSWRMKLVCSWCNGIEAHFLCTSHKQEAAILDKNPGWAQDCHVWVRNKVEFVRV
jgi:hypothetical protein